MGPRAGARRRQLLLGHERRSPLQRAGGLSPEPAQRRWRRAAADRATRLRQRLGCRLLPTAGCGLSVVCAIPGLAGHPFGRSVPKRHGAGALAGEYGRDQRWAGSEPGPLWRFEIRSAAAPPKGRNHHRIEQPAGGQQHRRQHGLVCLGRSGPVQQPLLPHRRLARPSDANASIGLHQARWQLCAVLQPRCLRGDRAHGIHPRHRRGASDQRQRVAGRNQQPCGSCLRAGRRL